jgi:hypothetical protein
MDKKIYGIVGYIILNNSDIYPNTEILLLSDMHNEDIKDCGDSNTIKITDLLNEYLNKNYKIILEEIPSKNELISLFPDSNHVNDTRDFYLKNFNKIYGADIRLDLIDIYLLDNATKPLITFLLNIYNFFINKNNLYDEELIKKYYLKMLVNFKNFNEKYYDYLIINPNNIDNVIYNDIIYEINKITDDIMDFYIYIVVYLLLKNNNNKKIVIYSGLYHTQNLYKYLQKYMLFKIKNKDGLTNIDYKFDNNLCIKYFNF